MGALLSEANLPPPQRPYGLDLYPALRLAEVFPYRRQGDLRL